METYVCLNTKALNLSHTKHVFLLLAYNGVEFVSMGY